MQILSKLFIRLVKLYIIPLVSSCRRPKLFPQSIDCCIIAAALDWTNRLKRIPEATTNSEKSLPIVILFPIMRLCLVSSCGRKQRDRRSITSHHQLKIICGEALLPLASPSACPSLGKAFTGIKWFADEGRGKMDKYCSVEKFWIFFLSRCSGIDRLFKSRVRSLVGLEMPLVRKGGTA